MKKVKYFIFPKDTHRNHCADKYFTSYKSLQRYLRSKHTEKAKCLCGCHYTFAVSRRDATKGRILHISELKNYLHKFDIARINHRIKTYSALVNLLERKSQRDILSVKLHYDSENKKYLLSCTTKSVSDGKTYDASSLSIESIGFLSRDLCRIRAACGTVLSDLLIPT